MIKVHLSQSYGFFSSHVWVWELDPNKAWAPENWCFWTVVLEKILESPWDHKEFKPVNTKGNQPWMFIRRTDAGWSSITLAIWCKELTQWKRPWCWKRQKARVEGDDRGWDCRMVSLTQWTDVCTSFGRWWRTGRPGVLPSMRSQRVRYYWATEQGQCQSKVVKLQS